MTKRQRTYEKGDAGVVVLVILVVVLMGALGWMFWKNMDKKSDANTAQTQQTTDIPQKEAVLAIKDWKVEIPVDDTLEGVSIESVLNEDNAAYVVRVKESVLFDDESKTGTQEVGVLQRFKATDKATGMYGNGETFAEIVTSPTNDNKDKMVQLDEYVYVFNNRQAGAYEGVNEAEVAADKKLEMLATKDFPAALQKIRAQK